MWRILFNVNMFSKCKCWIPGTWHDSSTVIFTVEELCQHRKKKKSCPWLLKNRASHCWRIVPVTVEQSHQRLLNNRARDSSTSKFPRDNVCSEIPLRSYHKKSSQLITIGINLLDSLWYGFYWNVFMNRVWIMFGNNFR